MANPTCSLRVKYWGVRGSIPAPLTSEQVYKKMEVLIENLVNAKPILKNEKDELDPVKVKAFLDTQTLAIRGTYGGNTTCLEIQARDSPLIIIDAGSGMRQLGLELIKRKFSGQSFNPLSTDPTHQLALHGLFTHVHWDHIQGFPFFVPAFFPDVSIQFHAKANNRKSLEETLKGQQEYPNFPIVLEDMPCKLEPFDELKGLTPRTLQIGSVIVTPVLLTHPDGVFAYKLSIDGKTVVIATDTEQHNIVDTRLVKLANNADILYYDAQYMPEEYTQKIDWGHSTFEWAVLTALAANVKCVVLGHHEPTRDDFGLETLLGRAVAFKDEQLHLERNRDKKIDIVMAHEGLVQEL